MAATDAGDLKVKIVTMFRPLAIFDNLDLFRLLRHHNSRRLRALWKVSPFY